MAGKIIITAPSNQLGKRKICVFINGVEQSIRLSEGETHEYQIDKDADVYGVVTLDRFTSSSLRVSANNVTEITFTLSVVGLFKSVLQIIETNKTPVSEFKQASDAPVYDLIGARGRRMKVYDDRCIILTKAGVGSFISGNGTDGEKTIYYSDVLGVQFKPVGVTLGYLQLETASGSMNNKTDNFFNENSFTFDMKISAEMEMVQRYVKQKVDEAKKQKNAPIVVTAATSISPADELKKFKELLDMGIITQEEFDAKKKQLLGL